MQHGVSNTLRPLFNMKQMSGIAGYDMLRAVIECCSGCQISRKQLVVGTANNKRWNAAHESGYYLRRHMSIEQHLRTLHYHLRNVSIYISFRYHHDHPSAVICPQLASY